MGGGDSPPEPGYVKSELTIARKNGMFKLIMLGYVGDEGIYPGLMGALNPSNGFTQLIVEDFETNTTGIATVIATRPFYYNGVKYQSEESAHARPLFEEWLSKEGQTVEVWLSS